MGVVICWRCTLRAMCCSPALARSNHLSPTGALGVCAEAMRSRAAWLLVGEVQVCSQGTLRYIWRPVGSMVDCVAVDRQGRCSRCDAGLVMSRGRCMKAAEIMHFDLDGHKIDFGAHAYEEASFHSFPSVCAVWCCGVVLWRGAVIVRVGFTAVGCHTLRMALLLQNPWVVAGPWGVFGALQFDGTDDYMQLPTTQVSCGGSTGSGTFWLGVARAELGPGVAASSAGASASVCL